MISKRFPLLFAAILLMAVPFCARADGPQSADPWKRDPVTKTISPRRAGDSASISATVPTNNASASPVTVTDAGYYRNNSAGAMTFNLPAITTATIGKQYCVSNYAGRSGAITLQMPAATQLNEDGTLKTAAGTAVSAGALGDRACVVAAAVGVYDWFPGKGTWTLN